VNAKGWELYATFRPEVDGWGGRGEVKCSEILRLRKSIPPELLGGSETADLRNMAVKIEGSSTEGPDELTTREHKKIRILSLEEYEAALDQDHTFDHVGLDFS
jgi:hypothetical protein